MGFRRSEVRTLSPRHRKASRDNMFRLALFFDQEAGLANSLANSPGVRAGGASPLETVAGSRKEPFAMGRPRKPYFRESDGWWVSRFKGEYVKLAKGQENEAEARARFHELM